MDVRGARFRVVVAVAIAGLTVAAVWLLVDWRRAGHFGTPESAVTATCHASIVSNYTPDRSTNIRIGWHRASDPLGIVWSALVVREFGGYRVEDCKYQRVVHG
jgi:hypothetical protein